MASPSRGSSASRGVVFSTRLATLLTMIGVSVGLGNVWRFPYMMGRFGGSAFLLVYLVCLVVFGLPAFMAEWALGRSTRRGTVGALTASLGRPGRGLAWLLLFGLAMALSYYTVVIANVAFAAGFAAVVGFGDDSAESFAAGLVSGPLQTGLSWAILVAALGVAWRGLRRGVERLSVLFVPLYGVLVSVLILFVLRQPGALRALGDFLRPDFSAVTGASVFAALGQAFFSLGVGDSLFVTYGSFLRSDEHIPTSATATAAGDLSGGLLAALFIVPATLAFGLDLDAGPGLMFSTLPELFSRMPSGNGLAVAFFSAVLVVAFLSLLAGLEVLIGGLREGLGFSEGKAIVTVGFVEAVVLLPSAWKPDLIGVLDLTFGSGFACLGGGVAVVGIAWGLGRERTLGELFEHPSSFAARFYYHWIRWIVPLGILVILVLFLEDALRQSA